MRVKILGSAAGGGFPQWNCGCSNCRRLRDGTLNGKGRTQSQVAVTLDNHSWYLLNASPDLRAQIEATRELQPREGVRNTPIAAVVLTSAELDHVIGLLHLREFQPLRIYATPSIRRILLEENTVYRTLQQAPRQMVWTDIQPGKSFEFEPAAGAGSDICCEPLAMPGSYPAFARQGKKAGSVPDEAVLGLRIEARGRGKRLFFAPSAARGEESWRQRLEDCDLLLFDGTFWDDDELARTRGGGPTATEMGHLPISGPQGSLELMGHSKRPRKVFIHVNNTNPILDEDSAEYGRVRAAGWEVAHDGMEFEL